MSAQAVEVFVAIFADEVGAKETLRDFKAAHRQGSLRLIDAAIIVRTTDDKVKIEETADPSGKRWGARGAIAGGLVGLIFPPSIVASALIGGGAGALWAKIHDHGIPDRDLKAIGDSMEPGSSAIIAIAEDHVVEELQRGIDGYRRIARHALSAEAALVVTEEHAAAKQPA